MYDLSQAELKLAEIIWEKYPVPASDVVKRAETEYGWKRTTVYTLLKRMNDKGIVVNENAVVTALISRDEFFSGQSRGFVDNTFNGSLPMFITAFIKGGKLSSKQAEEIRRLIDESGEGDV